LTLPTHDFDESQIKFRRGEKYVSLASNHQFLGTPYGVYVGFVPSIDGTEITFSPDPDCGFSFLRVLSTDDPLAVVDVYSESALTLDFATWIAALNAFVPGVVFPIYVIARASYLFGQASTAEFFTRVGPAVGDDEVQIGIVGYDGTDLSISIEQPLSRDNPFAWSNAPLGYGFMPDGAAADLITGLSVTAEVEAARTDLAGTTHPSLNDRLDEDLSGSSMAGRLAHSVRAIQSNDYTLTAATTSLNVSTSFSAVSRIPFPALDFDGGGSEVQSGAITGPSDAVRNVCVPVDSFNRERLIDDPNSRNVVYGRLDYEEIVQTGTHMFNGGGLDVTGTFTQWLTELEPGDLTQGADGLFYEVASVTSDVLMTLAQPYQGISGSGVNLQRRRFTLTFKVLDNGVESDASLDALTFRFFFPVWASLDQSVLDGQMLLHAGGEPPALPDATTAVSGKVLLDPNAPLDPDPQGGALRQIKNAGIGVADNIYDLNFLGAAPGAGSGIVDVTQRGQTGPTGPPGTGLPGPIGPQGPPGTGFSGGLPAQGTTNHFLVKRSVFSIFNDLTTPPGFVYEHIVTAASVSMTEILWANTGVWYFDDTFGSTRERAESWKIVDVILDSPQQVRAVAQVEDAGGNRSCDIGIYLNIAGS
jgi:hypothetical protein